MRIGLFRKRNKERAVQSLLKGKLSRALKRVEDTCVAYLQKKEQRLTLVQKKWCLYAFCVVFGGITLFMLTTAILQPVQQSPKKDYAITPLPRPILMPHHEVARFSNRDSLSVRQLRHLWDSLYATEVGRHEIDSFMRVRPGFLDSFKQLENIIHP